MTEQSDKNPKTEPPSVWKIAGWGLAIYAGTRLASVLLEATSMAAAVAQAVIAEWGSGRLGVVWTKQEAGAKEPPTGGSMARRALFGAGIGAVMAGVTCGVLVATRGAILDHVSPSVSIVALSLVSAGLYAMRDELVLHGVVLRAIERSASPMIRVVACGVTSGAAAIGDGATARAIAVQSLVGLVAGALWVRDRGAWPAWGLSTGFRFTIDMLFAGGLFNAQIAASAWGGADAGVLGGTAAVLALAPFGAAALAWIARQPAPQDPTDS
jgi:hypothetical protein